MSSEMDEIRCRLTAVEAEQAAIKEQARQSRRAAELYAVVDHDLADLRLAFGQQRLVLNAIGQTQADHSITLRNHGQTLGGLVLEVSTIRQTQTEHGLLLAEHGQTLKEHGQVLNEHTEVLNSHTEVLNSHTEMLNTHTEVLNMHTEMLSEQGQLLQKILARLPDSPN